MLQPNMVGIGQTVIDAQELLGVPVGSLGRSPEQDVVQTVRRPVIDHEPISKSRLVLGFSEEPNLWLDGATDLLTFVPMGKVHLGIPVRHKPQEVFLGIREGHRVGEIPDVVLGSQNFLGQHRNATKQGVDPLPPRREAQGLPAPLGFLRELDRDTFWVTFCCIIHGLRLSLGRGRT